MPLKPGDFRIPVNSEQHRQIHDQARLEFLMVEPGSGQIVRSNLAARENLGFKADELHRKRLSDIDCQHSPTEILQRLSTVESGESNRCDFYSRHRRADNSEYPVQVFIYPSTWQNNRALVVLVLDISGQTNARPKAAITELMGESSTYGLKGGWQLFLPEKHFYWTEEVFTIHGIRPNPDSAVTLNIALQFYLPESQQRLQKRLTEATADPVSWHEELTLSTAGLTKKRLRISSYPQFKEGNLVGFFGSVEDLTEPAPSEDLTGTPLAYEQVVNTAPYGIFQLDAKKSVTNR
jgi:PAS domain S-box-containing protein